MPDSCAVSKVSKSIWGFDPTTISGCVLWLDGADRNATLISDGSPASNGQRVAQWLDKSIMENHASNSVVANQPILNSELLSFTGTEFFQLTNSSAEYLPSGISDATYFTVTSCPSSAKACIISHGTDSDSQSRTVWESYNKIGANVTGGTTYDGINPVSSTLIGDASFQHITTLTIKDLIGSLWFFGTPVDNTNIDLQNTVTAVNTGTALGYIARNVPSRSFNYFNGIISEILVYNSALSNSDRQIVELYLATKWNLFAQILMSSHIYFLSRYKVNSRGFAPTDIEGCQLWIDPADSRTVTLTGSNVTSITDKSGLLNNLTNSSSSITYASTLNDLPVLTFPSGAAGNSLTTTSTITRDGSKRTYFFVIKYSSSVTNSTSFIHYLKGASIEDSFRHHGTTNQAKTLDFIPTLIGTKKASQDYGPSFNADTAVAFYGGKVFVVSCVRDRENYIFSTNGVSVTETVNPVPDSISGGAYVIEAGTSDHQVGDVIIYNSALTKHELIQVEGYLMWKWGVRREPSLKITIPLTHPYYKFPPNSVTPKRPQEVLYKKEFNPVDLSPVIWIDPLDTSKVTTNASGRVTRIENKGSLNLPFVPPPDIDGPLVTRSAAGDGVGLPFLDFSNGGNFYVTVATILTSTTLRLTTSIPHRIPVGAFVTLTVSTGNYSNGQSATVNSGPFQIVRGTVVSTGASTRSITFTTASPHGISSGQSIFLINKQSTFYDRTTSATSIAGSYTAASVNSAARTITINVSSTGTVGEMFITDVSVRNNVGTTGYYNTVTGTTGSIVFLTSYSNRVNGSLSNLTASINYGQIPFTSVNYNTDRNAVIQTPIDHGIPSGAPISVCSNNSLCMPFQTTINSANPPNATFRGSVSVSGTTTFIINVTTNPFFIGSVGTPNYIGVGPLRVTLFPGTRFAGNFLTTTATYTNLFTITGSNSTRIVFNLFGGATSTGSSTLINAHPLIVDSVTATAPVRSSYINTRAIASLPSNNSISYSVNRALGTELSGSLLNTVSTPFSFAHTPDVNNGYILYPLRGCALENLAINPALDTNQMTIIWASCLRQGYTRSNFSNANRQSSVISAAVSTNGAGGGDSVGRDFRIQTSSDATNRSSMSIIRNNIGGQSPLIVSPGARILTSEESHFRINHAIINVSATTVDDVPALSHAFATNGWGHATRFSNSEVEATVAGQTSTTLIPTHLRIGANTHAVNTFTLKTIAGSGNDEFGAFTGDGGPATSARINYALGVSVDTVGNVYIADTYYSHRIRMIPASTRTYFGIPMNANSIYTIAGTGDGWYDTGVGGFNNDDITATSAQLNQPSGVAVDTDGNVYIADTLNHRIRMIPVSNRQHFTQLMLANRIYTIAGNGTAGFNSDDVIGTAARLNQPNGLAVDTVGNVYIADTLNHRIRMIPVATGSYFGIPMNANRIYTIAGNGTSGFNSDDVTGTAARLSYPNGVAVDTVGNVYIADTFNVRIRMIPVATGSYFGQAMTANRIYTIAGIGCRGVAVDTVGNVYTADGASNRICMLPVTTGRYFGIPMNANSVYTIAGSGVSGFNGESGPPTSMRLDDPSGVAVDTYGNVYIVDTFNVRIRIVESNLYTDYQLTSEWYEGGLGDIMMFNSVLTFEQRKLVEGYIAEKYRCNKFLGGVTTGTGSFLHPYRTTPTKISSAVDLSKIYSQGLAAWFDAANISTLYLEGTGSGANVIGWFSVGGVTLAIQPTETRRPTIVENARNGLPGIRFSVVSSEGSPIGTDYTYPITRFSTLSNNNEYTIISVYKQTPYAATKVICNILLTASGTSRLSVFTDKFTYKSGATEQTITYSPESTGSNTTYLLVNYRRGNTMYARRNGLSVGTTTMTDLNITGNQFGIVLGAFLLSTDSPNPFIGDIYENIIFRHALTDQEIFQIEGYLAWKWGLNDVLPTTHSYYGVIP
jgi:hypothetical protein